MTEADRGGHRVAGGDKKTRVWTSAPAPEQEPLLSLLQMEVIRRENTWATSMSSGQSHAGHGEKAVVFTYKGPWLDGNLNPKL